MARFRKKPVEVEAVQWLGTPESGTAIQGLAQGCQREVQHVGSQLGIATSEGFMRASVGDWIIKGIAGELYPCKPDIFEATYEPIG